MSLRAVVLRPQPGNDRTAARLRAAGAVAVQLPLFTVRPIAWSPPDPARYDALLLTSANVLRHGGTALAALAPLPVVAVGAATARAAEEAGLRVVITGRSDAQAAATAALSKGHARLLHLAGREHVAMPGVDALVVYASDPAPIEPATLDACRDAVALVHSARAAARLRDLLDRDGPSPADVTLAALSPAVANAAGVGWRHLLVADVPTDEALVALALTDLAGEGITRA